MHSSPTLYEHGWKKVIIPIPVMYEGPMAFQLHMDGEEYIRRRNMGYTETCGSTFTHMIDIGNDQDDEEEEDS